MTSSAAPGRIRVWAATSTGRVRRRNEDHVGIATADSLIEPVRDDELVAADVRSGPLLVVVADGLGGHPSGDVASHMATRHLLELRPTDPDELMDAVIAANEFVYRAMDLDVSMKTMGTTIAAVLVHDEGVAVVNVGDSAVFELVDDHLVQLSIDDTLDEDPSFGARSGVVTQTIGGFERFDDVRPHLVEFDADPHLRLLLCSDGLSAFVSSDTISNALISSEGPTAVRAMIALADDAGGHDNVTVAVIDLG